MRYPFSILLSFSLLAASSIPVRATSIEGLRLHLQQNKKEYKRMGKKLKRMGLIKMDDPANIEADIIALAAREGASEEDDKAALSGAMVDRGVDQYAAGRMKAAKLAEKLAGRRAPYVDDVSDEDAEAFDPETGRSVPKTDEGMYRSIVNAIANQKCHTSIAMEPFKAMLWGAAVLDYMSRVEKPWPVMIDETKAIWDGHVATIAKARAEYMKNGAVGPVGAHMPVIIYKPQPMVGATATWQTGGIITVGDRYAALSGPAKLAVLFHEDEHHWDDKTKGGLHENYWTGKLSEPDDTPSGKNWTETLAYRHMKDWVNVLDLPWPTFEPPVSKLDLPSL